MLTHFFPDLPIQLRNILPQRVFPVIEPPPRAQPTLPWNIPEEVVEKIPVPDDQARLVSRNMTMAVVEALNGVRALNQLDVWFPANMIRQITIMRKEKSRVPWKLYSLHLQLSTPMAVEVTAHLRQGKRSSMAAMQLIRGENRWHCAQFVMVGVTAPGFRRNQSSNGSESGRRPIS